MFTDTAGGPRVGRSAGSRYGGFAHCTLGGRPHTCRHKACRYLCLLKSAYISQISDHRKKDGTITAT